MPFIFLNPLSEVTSGSCRKREVVAIIAPPSCTLIRKLVSATKLNPFISDSFLISNSIQTSLELSEMFTQGFFFAFFGNAAKRFSYLFLSNRLCNFNNHNSKIIKNDPYLIFENIIRSNNYCFFKHLFILNKNTNYYVQKLFQNRLAEFIKK